MSLDNPETPPPEISMWVIYDHPLDYPDGYIARRWIIKPDKLVATSDVKAGKNLTVIRFELERVEGRAQLPRDPNDDPKILEIWI